jgi:hypothetical protein
MNEQLCSRHIAEFRGRKMTHNKFCSLSYQRQNMFLLFILKFCFNTSETRFLLRECRTQNPLYVWVPWSISVGKRKLIYLMIMFHSCRTQKPLICLSSMFHTCRTQEKLICLSFSMFVGHNIPVICLFSMFHKCRTHKPFIRLCFRLHAFRIPKPLTCISKDLIKSRVIRLVRVISKIAY